MEDPYANYDVSKRAWIPQMHRRSVPFPPIFNQNYNTPGNFREGKESRDDIDFLPYDRQPQSYTDTFEELLDNPSEEQEDSTMDEIEAILPMVNLLSKLREPPDNFEYRHRSSLKPLQGITNGFEATERTQDVDVEDLLRRQILRDRQNNRDIPERFSLSYNTPDNFRAGWESRDEIEGDEELPESRIYFDEIQQENPQEEYGSGAHFQPDDGFRGLQNEIYDFGTSSERTQNLFRELNNVQDSSELYNGKTEKYVPENDKLGKAAGKHSRVYTEGGVVYVPENKLSGNWEINLITEID